MLIAIFHIVGTLVVLFIFFFVSGLVEQILGRRRYKLIMESAAAELQLGLEDLLNENGKRQLAKYMAERYGRDKLANRISDAFRPVIMIGEGTSYLVQVVIVIWAAWLAFSEHIAFAQNAWFAVGAAVLLYLVFQLGTVLCYLLTGRGPGEASDARKMIRELVNSGDRV